MKNSLSEVARRSFQRIALLFSRTKEVAQVDSQYRITDDQPTNIQPMDSLPDMDVALEWVRATDARKRAEQLAAEMNECDTSSQRKQ